LVEVPVLIVGIAGGTASGKTTVVDQIAEALGPSQVAVLALDHYYRDLSELKLAERKSYNFDHPDAFDIDLLLEHIGALRRDLVIDRPCYSFGLSVRTGKTVPVKPAPVLLVEGILALAIPRLLSTFDLRLFVDSASDIRLMRRIRRDIEERGRTLDETLSRYIRWVRPMHEAFVGPSKVQADLVVRNHRNPERAIRLLVRALGG
jgi:uridine kinase